MDTGRNEKGQFVKGCQNKKGYIPSVSQREKQSIAMKGRILSDEHKAKIKAGLAKAIAEGRLGGSRNGWVPWNKGMRRANGDPIPTYTYPELSEESKRNKAAARMGKHYSAKTEFKKGLVPWNAGKNWPPEMIERMSAAHKDPSAETREKMSKAKKGKHHSAEVIKKMLTRRTPTSLEMKFQCIIDKNGLPYKFVGDGSFMIGRKNPDFININGEKTVVEVYSRYYKLRHAETIQEWKEERQRVFEEYGWAAIFFDETQVNEENVVRQLRTE